MKNFYLLLLCIVLSSHSYCQQEWIEVIPQGEFFSFSMPDTPQTSINTSESVTYIYGFDSIDIICDLAKHDSSFLYYLNLLGQEDSILFESSDSLANPLISVSEYFSEIHDSVLFYNVQDLTTENPDIICREISMAYIDNFELPKLFAIRIYYNGHDFLTFSIECPYNKQEEFDEYKELFFASIIIY